MANASIELKVVGMSCDHCVQHVKQALEAVKGVGRTEVDLKTGRATVWQDDDCEPHDLIAAVREEGYDAQIVGD